MLPSSLVVIYVGSIFVELSIFMYVCMAINLFDFDQKIITMTLQLLREYLLQYRLITKFW